MEFCGDRHKARSLKYENPSIEKVHELMGEYKIDFQFLAAFIVIVNAGSKQGTFMRVKAVSTVDLSQGHVYWWLIKYFFIFGVQHDQLIVPGLEKVNSAGTVDPADSPLAIMEKVADDRILAAETVLRDQTLDPRGYFFQRCNMTEHMTIDC